MGESEKRRFGEFLQLAKCEMNGYRGNFRGIGTGIAQSQMSFLICFHGRFPTFCWCLQTISIRWENSDSPRWKSYKMPCLLLSWRFLERYSWTKVIWSVLQFLSPKFDSSGRGPHKPHHKLLYSGGVISDDVWSCKVFTFQHISTEPWKITVLNYTLIWLYNLHILTSIYIPLN